MYRILLIEDSETDAFLITRMLREACREAVRYEVHHVSSLHGGHDHLQTHPSDVVLMDMGLPDSESLDGVRSILEKWPSLPIVVLTGLNDDDVAITAVKAGAQDYIAKEHLNPTLLRRAVHYAVERQSLRDRLVKQNAALETALAEVHTLQGLIRICSVCKKVVNDDGAWEGIEKYVRDHSAAKFTHGYCPACYTEMMNTLDRTQ